MRKIILFILLILIIGSCEKRIQIRNGKIVSVQTMEDLHDASVFQFVIMSDNKGDSGKNSPIFANMENCIEQNHSEFVIGMGDHLKIGWDNSFLELMKNDSWWNENFYPNIADGENEFFGNSQADWAAGGKLLDFLNMSAQAKLDIRDNNAEYYLRRKVGNFTIHLIQLHYPDEPDIDSLAFRADSKQFMLEKLRTIQKSDHDIVIVGAHSRTGFWFDKLNEEEQKTLLQKSDLVLSATTHFFERQIIAEYENEGPLFINTGSITYPTKYSPHGYVLVHVLKHPPMLIVQYIDATKEKPELQHQNYAFIKKINGEIIPTNFRPIRPEENVQRTVSYLPEDITSQELNLLVNHFYLQHTKADVSLQQVNQGLGKGEIRYHQLWDIFPYNNEIVTIKLNKKWIEEQFTINTSKFHKDSLLLVTSHFQAKQISDYLTLPENRIVPSGINEISALEKLLSERKGTNLFNPTSLVQGLACVNVFVNNYAKNYHFYHNVLELPLKQEKSYLSCTFQLGENWELNLIGGKKKIKTDEAKSRASIVLSTSSVSELFERLQKENIPLFHAQPQNLGDGRYWFMFRDPAGNILEATGGL